MLLYFKLCDGSFKSLVTDSDVSMTRPAGPDRHGLQLLYSKRAIGEMMQPGRISLA